MTGDGEKLSGPAAGLGATGTTADEMSSGERNPGTTYGDPTGTGTASADETTGGPEQDLSTGVEEAEK
jgi:hypothetical protein